MTKTYIGVKSVTAWPEMKAPTMEYPNGRTGYAVKYATWWSKRDQAFSEGSRRYEGGGVDVGA